jgi:hypothetical protein
VRGGRPVRSTLGRVKQHKPMLELQFNVREARTRVLRGAKSPIRMYLPCIFEWGLGPTRGWERSNSPEHGGENVLEGLSRRCKVSIEQRLCPSRSNEAIAPLSRVDMLPGTHQKYMQQWSSQEGCHQRILALVFWCERGKIRQGRMHDALKAFCVRRGDGQTSPITNHDRLKSCGKRTTDE